MMKNDGTLYDLLLVLFLMLCFFLFLGGQGYQNKTVPENFYPRTLPYP